MGKKQTAEQKAMTVAAELFANAITLYDTDEEITYYVAENPSETCSLNDQKVGVLISNYDHIELILDEMTDVLDLDKGWYRTENVSKINKRKKPLNDNYSTLFVNCSAEGINEKGIENIRKFVENGGKLVTTDWALETIIKEAFPGTIEPLTKSRFMSKDRKIVTYKKNVYIEPTDRADGLGKQMLGLDRFKYDTDHQPKWFLDTQSYPMNILDRKLVVPLITSSDMKYALHIGNEERKNYENMEICAAFPYGKGVVIHFVSHIERQLIESEKEEKIPGTDFSITILGDTIDDVDTVSDAALVSNFTAFLSCYHIMMTSAEEINDRLTKKSTPIKKPPELNNYIGIKIDGTEAKFKYFHTLEENWADFYYDTLYIGSCKLANVTIEGIKEWHAEIYVEDQVTYIKPFQYDCEILVNGLEIREPYALAEGDSINLGNGSITIENI